MAFRNLIRTQTSSKSPLLLECLLCRDKFPAEAVEKKQYFAKTCICANCYRQGQKQPAKMWCFGKYPKRNSPGYSEENESCTLLCPDKEACVYFLNHKPKKEQ